MVDAWDGGEYDKGGDDGDFVDASISTEGVRNECISKNLMHFTASLIARVRSKGDGAAPCWVCPRIVVLQSNNPWPSALIISAITLVV